MPPKKRDKEAEAAKTPRLDTIQADHELFLQAFEKPTQIYRYLRTRNLCAPVFLHRTLTYMKYRMSRTHKNRKTFKVDSLLEKITKAKDGSVIQPGFINITFLSFNDQNLKAQGNVAEVETILLKINHKKRKESSAPCMQVSLGKAEVPINPENDSIPSTASTISISTEKFNSNGGPMAKSHILLFRLKIKKNSNGAEEPDPKRIKMDSENVESQLYGAELTVYDKHNRCYLTDGDYDVVAQNFVSNSPKKHSNWENISDLMDTCGNLDAFMKDPILKFKLNWSSESSAKIVDRPKPYSHFENKENIPVIPSKNPEKMQIVYQFVYNNNSRQQTEACEDLHCPWCSINCDQLYTLLKHLKSCHSRFTFTYVPISSGARVDVAINESYDGSYTGSPHDLITQPLVCTFSRNGPVRRASVTHILVCHPKRPKSSLSEFIESDDCEYDGQRPFITGHNRLYHHTTTCLPIYPKEMDVDSEGENDPEWSRNKTMTMIDEFTDVNEGEKELMKMWNLHVMKYGFVGNCQIPLACQMFVQQKGKELLLRNLYKNFVVHMSNLFDFGLVSSVCMYTTIQKLQDMVAETGALSTILKESREAQIDNWSKTGCVFSKEKCVRTPNGRKTGTVGNPRRKGLSTPSTENFKRNSDGEPTRKRLSLSLGKNEFSDKVFSAGIDLLELYKPTEDKVKQYWTALQDCWINLYGFSAPTVACINGHAPAGGCLLSLSCEYRVMSKEKTIGLNETKVGLVAPDWFIASMENVIGHRQSELALTSGKMFTTEEALKIGLIDEIAENSEDAISKSRAFLKSFEKVVPSARATTKHSLRRKTIQDLVQNKEADLNIFLKTVMHEKVQQSLELYIKSLKKGQSSG